ncbi:putative alpha-hydroxynitrile lyase [Arabidopsis thaliana]|jgi:pimeloyl-ACP methyl ester carboxylesterase|uniref:Methylesterase 17 n=1 Tax=Arabidopsis thaliana TaxID=3702 RepID=MES17_ARATH|nr:methyl esterase 17 [Arabidopsis thaliana]Q9SG92.1 RecName: Full=Methylesterase 17; Short=AtMES17; AltName: Full=Methyl indole-3-acetic acid esterase [Arabidopsis thaliana]AAF19562.1 putative alpha-hydroxynitrile lyase [Arabidopsis thaliana]AAL36348.1 putative alpha-hydroxynitrile lyase [Arabidopsis thaliana]AAM20326.1 putative alpha-hydroxynitrile lyase [Arabidopsis thaliana]AEE74965.1 methyl esterase 17 [Arabidopsis thaliana]|eukprot:NP_187698.1 methyl esterase 17 [Arabidopsis thaliana]
MAEENQEETLELKPSRKPPHFVLIHGMSLGSWCWYKIKCLMEVSGFTVTCIDLKSSGIDSSSVDSLTTFDQYNQPLIDFLSSFPEQEQVILVGHSAGGLSLTSAIQRFPKKICLAVFIGASMLKNGLQTDEDMKDGVPDLSEHGDVYELGFGLGPENPPTSAIIKPEYRRKLLYHMSPQQECSLAALMMRPAPILALTTAKLEEEEKEKGQEEQVPRVYIKTLLDRVMKPEQQDAMIRRWPPSQVYELESDHSPFFSNPFVLFGLLIKAAVSVGSI